MRRLAGAAGIGCLLAAAACTAPEVVIACHPENAAVYRDGARLAPRTPVAFETPYYGTLLVELDAVDQVDRFAPVRATVAVYPPLTGWLFGLDLLAEAADWMFGSFEVRSEHELPAIGDAALDDTRLATLLAAARAAAVAR
jgi:hypothetical protein